VRPGSRDVLAVGLRVRDTYADGVNLRSGVLNTQVTQSTFRTYAGILLSWQKTIRQVSFDRVSVTGSGTYGIEAHATGSATFANTTVSGSGTGGLLDDMGFVLERSGGSSGF
jgi:hypothetical protein